MPQYGDYSVLQKSVDTIKNNQLPYAEPVEGVNDFLRFSRIYRMVNYENGNPCTQITTVNSTTALAPSVSTSTYSTPVNSAIGINEAGDGFVGGLTEIQMTPNYGHGVIGSLGILNELAAVSSQMGVQELADVHEDRQKWYDAFSVQTVIDAYKDARIYNPEYQSFLHAVTDNAEDMPCIVDVVNDVTYIPQEGVNACIAALTELGLASGEYNTVNDPNVGTITAFRNKDVVYSFYMHIQTSDVLVSVRNVSYNGDMSMVRVWKDAAHTEAVSYWVCSNPNSYIEYDEYRNNTFYQHRRIDASTMAPRTYGNKTVYFNIVAWGDIPDVDVETSIPNTYNVDGNNDTAWAAYYGNKYYPEGFGPLPNANPVELEAFKDTTWDEKLGLLQAAQPAWVSNAKTINTIDADGNIIPKLWFPVQLGANAVNNDRTKPINTGATQVMDGSYPDELFKGVALGVTALKAVNSFPNTDPIKNPTVSPSFGDTDPKPPLDFTDGIAEGASAGVGAVVPDLVSVDMAYVYLPNRAQVSGLMNFLWSPTFSLDTLRKIFQDPIEAIVGLQQIYFDAQEDGTAEIYLGNVPTGVTGVKYTNKRFYRLDCGSVSLPETFGNVFDYQTNISIYLPFVGIVSVECSKLMRASDINVVYDLDILTGAGNAKIYVTRDSNKILLYTYGCQTASQYPISGSNHSGIVSTITSLGASAVGAFAGGVGGAIAAGSLVRGAGNVLGSLGGMSSHIQQSGGYMGIGALIHKKPYMIIEKPIPNMPVDYNKYDGYPYYRSTVLGNCKGMTKCGEVHLDVTGISSLEKDMIISELQKGVIL